TRNSDEKRIDPCSKTPKVKPNETIIKPTSPREIIQTPKRNDSCRLKPAKYAPSPHPAILEITATMSSKVANGNAANGKLRKSAFRPISTKKIGTRKA